MPINATIDYYPFGMQMPGRVMASGLYRYGFNGKEMDDEASGTGNQYDYGFRIYNPRLGKFLSVDPLVKDYPWYTPYQFAGNKPIWAIDLDGLEEKIITKQGCLIKATFVVEQKVINNIDIEKLQEKANKIFNSNHSIETEEEIFIDKINYDQYGPGLLGDRISKKHELEVKFEISVLPEDENDLNTSDLSKSRIWTKSGQSLGAIILMGDPEDPGFIPRDDMGNPVTDGSKAVFAFWRNDKIYLNPNFYDKDSPGFEDNMKKFGRDVNENLLTIIHEIGHDLGLDHKDGYPPTGNMSNKGSRIPTSDEIDKIRSNDNKNIIQPGEKY